jgi:hypothetical protein
VAGGQTLLVIVKGANGYRMAADSLDGTLVGDADRQLLRQVGRLHAGGAGSATATQLKVSEDQLSKLKGITAQQRYTISSEDQKKFEKLFEAWESAASDQKAAAGTALREAVKAFEGENAGTLKAELLKRVETVKGVLSEEQVKGLR